jgi:hypothetical protein
MIMFGREHSSPTMSMCYENFLYLAHLDSALLQLVLGCLSTIEKPYIWTKP